MFKKNEKNYTDLLGRTNRIVEGTKISGSIETHADIRLDGVLMGDLNVAGRLVIGPKGVVEGDVTCVNADVEGRIKGNVVVNEVLVVKASAMIEGEVTVGKLSVEPGAVFRALCTMTGFVVGEEK